MLKWYAAALALLVVAVGLWAFEPWRLFTSSEIDEDRPASSLTPMAPPARDDLSEMRSARPQPKDVTLSTGRLEDAEHDTSGRVVVLELADGRRFVRLEDLASSDGPDLHVWLSDRPSGGDWGSYDDGRYLRLGELKATHGNQNYEIPSGAELDGMRSVVIWCDRFNVAFGTAPVSLG